MHFAFANDIFPYADGQIRHYQISNSVIPSGIDNNGFGRNTLNYGKVQFIQIHQISNRIRQRCQLIASQLPKSYKITNPPNLPDFRQNPAKMLAECSPTVYIISKYSDFKFTRFPKKSGIDVN
jgi:hypothetical protein